MAGRVLGGRYAVQDKVGTGGMAIVYRGLDEVLGRTVAIKTMLPQYASDESFAMRFKQEAQAAAALQSPYIVSVYDWGKDEDTYYIVMEYLRGTDLKSGIRRHGALDPRKVAQIGSQIAQALSVAHKHDIIHRDIKPQNIMVQPDGNIKVMDFGIARAKNSHLTTDNSVLGTAHYVSPEQTQGRPLGPTTDIYSLGIVMYEAATGRVPFDGDDAISVALKQVNEQPLPPSQINPNVDPALEGIILRCMQKDPNARFQTADELYRVLRDYLAGQYQAVNTQTGVVPSPVVNRVDVRTTTSVIPSVERTGTGTTGTGRGKSKVKPLTATERAQIETEKQDRRRRRRFTLIAFFATLAVIAAGFGIIQFFGMQNDTQTVPNLLGMTEQDALAAIDGTNYFKRGDVTYEYSSKVDEGKVIDQDPDYPRKLERDTTIDITISRGPEPAKTVTIPDLKGKSPSEAEAELRKYKLVAQAGESVFNNDVAVNTVAAQSPAAGSTAQEGDTVIYQLSKGKEAIEVPNVVGQDRYTAEETLVNAGFEVEMSYESNSNVEVGYIIRQSATGAAERGTLITLVISTGPAEISIPDVTGYSASYAESALQEAGFYVSTSYDYSDHIDYGYVISQSPSGSATSGATVYIVVSLGPDTTTTPTEETTPTTPTTEGDTGTGTETTTGTTTTEAGGGGTTGTARN